MVFVWSVLGGYAVVLLIMFFAQRNLLYPAATDVPRLLDHGLPGLQSIETEPELGLVLTHWFHPPAGPEQPVILYFHGNAGHRGDRVPKMRPLIDAGFGLLITGYRGYGGNPGKPSEEGLAADARSVHDWLMAQGYRAEQIVIFGESLGTAVSVALASERPPAALVLEAPPSSIADVAAAHYWYLPVRLLIHDAWDSQARIGAIQSPLLLLHGERDHVVPVRFGRKLYEAATQPKQALFHETAMHSDLLNYREVVETVVNFIRDKAAKRQ
ncbi:alpha/beta hydrolase [Pelagibius litoralis]|uniref:Alpha/beta hydrolase n=1 Tax=Pelagibius litoralis TaxID=374515 RepID=A0A967C2J0_9PROT|nr:alpha/beta hydrolase [Pelagibius litoralis]NIA67105.1 alpha/beta hydrolase [Pelagibius litoralis]